MPRLLPPLVVAACFMMLRPATAAAQTAPVTLATAIGDALRNSPELASAEDAVRLAGVAQRLAASDFALKFAPAISAGTDPVAGRMRNAALNVSKRLATGATVFANFSSYEYGSIAKFRDSGYTIGVSQPLLRGFATSARAGVDSANQRLTSAIRERDTTRGLLVIRVARQYFDVVKQQRIIVAAEKAAERASALRQSSEARTKVGLATELDVLRARILESQTAAALASARTALAEATDRLALVLGRTIDSPLEIDADATAFPPADSLDDLPGSIDELVAVAVSSRAEIVDARARSAEAGRNESIARWNQLPPLALDVNYTQRGVGAANNGLNDLLGGWHVGVSSSYSIDRSTSSAALESATIATDAAGRGVTQSEQRVIVEVRGAYRAWQSAAVTLAIQREAVVLAEQERDLATLRYERGLASSLDVVGAETQLLQVQNALIAAELDRRVFALELRRVVGRLDLESLSK